MRIAVNGAGIAGLSAAILLARDGHDVVVLERDRTPLPDGPDAAFRWQRRGAPQVRHSHALLARLRNLLRDHLPDVLDDLLAAGATEVSWADMAPATIEDRSPRPGDEDLVMLACRRTTFEWVLRRAAVSTERVEVRDGQAVTGLVAERSGGQGLLRVGGVRTGAGALHADLVVDAGGRRSALPRFLAEHGVEVREDEQDTGIIYLSRFYRLRPGVEPPDPQPLNGGDLGYLKFAVFRGDNRAFSITFAVATDDAELRSLAGTGRFDATTAAIPTLAPWVAEETSEPVTGVHVMAGLVNRQRHLVEGSRPVALGVLAAGDASVCTNPLYGRGCALGAVHARLLAESVAEAGDMAAGAEEAALRFHEATERELVPWYRAAVTQDEMAKRALHGEEPAGDGPDPRSLLVDGLLPLARVDADVSRAWVRTFNLLSPPDAMIADEQLTRRVLEHWLARESRPPEPPLGPGRDELLAALAQLPEPVRSTP